MEKIIEKMKESIKNTNTQNDMVINEEFVDKCSQYIQTTNFISYTEVKDLIGYKQKRTVSEILGKFDFVADVDYKIVKEKVKGTCKPIDEIYMTIDTIKCICLMSPTEKSQQFRRYFLQMEKLFKEIASAEYLSKLTNPIYEFNLYDTDVGKFKGHETIYVIHIEKNIYKFGHTGIITRRLETHKRELNYDYVVKMWSCDDRSVSKNIEDNIKLYIKHKKIGIIYKNHSEIFQTDDLFSILTTIDDYHKIFCEQNKKRYQDARLTQKKEILSEMNKLFENIGDDKILKKAICKSLETKIFSGSDVNEKDISCMENLDESESECESICSDISDFEESVSNACLLRKCQRCLAPHTEEEFGINTQNKKPYMNCENCRDKQKLSDIGRSDEKKQKRREKCREYNAKNKEAIQLRKKIKREEKKNTKPEVEENQLKIEDEIDVEIQNKLQLKKEKKQQKVKEYYKENASEIIEQKKVTRLKKLQQEK